MTYAFRVTTVLAMEYIKGDKKSKHIDTKLTLELSEGLEKAGYITDDDQLTKEGVIAISNTLVQGLVQCVNHGEKLGVIKREDFIGAIGREIERSLKAAAV
jgi:hypothetical protein